MRITTFLSGILSVVKHPAVLFSAGNTALAFGQAEPLGIAINAGLTVTIVISKIIEVSKGKTFGIPFSILAIVNFFTVFSIEFNRALGTGSTILVEGLKRFDGTTVFLALSMFDINNLFTVEMTALAAHFSATAFLIWGIGHLFASYHERKHTQAKKIIENHQTYYGAADMVAVNASGSLNPFSFPFMVFGFIKSIFIGTKVQKENRLYREITAARLYGIGYLVGAVTSLGMLNFSLAQLLWALAYLQFTNDT